MWCSAVVQCFSIQAPAISRVGWSYRARTEGAGVRPGFRLVLRVSVFVLRDRFGSGCTSNNFRRTLDLLGGVRVGVLGSAAVHAGSESIRDFGGDIGVSLDRGRKEPVVDDALSSRERRLVGNPDDVLFRKAQSGPPPDEFRCEGE